MNDITSDTTGAEKLGDGKSGFEEGLGVADAGILEIFPTPGIGVVMLGGLNDVAEFTSLCPKTSQPDFARIIVRYAPRESCIESKSWKLYLGSYRNAKEFHETCVTKIAQDIADVCDPHWVDVRGEFTPRGGISINPRQRLIRGTDGVFAPVSPVHTLFAPYD